MGKSFSTSKRENWMERIFLEFVTVGLITGPTHFYGMDLTQTVVRSRASFALETQGRRGSQYFSFPNLDLRFKNSPF